MAAKPVGDCEQGVVASLITERRVSQPGGLAGAGDFLIAGGHGSQEPAVGTG